MHVPSVLAMVINTRVMASVVAFNNRSHVAVGTLVIGVSPSASLRGVVDCVAVFVLRRYIVYNCHWTVRTVVFFDEHCFVVAARGQQYHGR